jgi:hypothetical protein
MSRSTSTFILVLATAVLLSGCISGRPQQDTYTDQSGKTTIIESDREQCERSCNEDYSRCMDSTGARNNGGINGPSGMFGASSDCRNDLNSCLKGCKSR